MPNKPQWKTLKKRLTEILEVIKRNNPVTQERVMRCLLFVRKSWKSIAIILPAFLLLYYIVGSWATQNIDKSLVINPEKPTKGLAVVHSAAGLITREVDDHMWTPNLPFIFPGYVLDNMPQYQLGIIDSLKSVIKVLAANYDSEKLNKAAEFLNYPGNIWLLSKTENLSLAPSSGAQYRKARKALLRFNDGLILPTGKNEDILLNVLHSVIKGLENVAADIEQHVREHSSEWLDGRADNVFYYAQGRLYGYYVMLSALGVDFQTEILAAGQYENWTSLSRTLENGFLLEPFIVRNGKPESTTAPNHLLALGYYTAKAGFELDKIINVITRRDQSNAY